MAPTAKSSKESYGVVFPAAADGKRSTTAVNQAVVADALRAVDDEAARAAELEANWRSDYLPHLRQLVVSGLPSAAAAQAVATTGLASLRERMHGVNGVIGAKGSSAAADEASEQSLRDWADSVEQSHEPLQTDLVTGTADPEHELTLPYHGRRLHGDDVLARLDEWVRAGTMEPTAAEAVRTVAANPQWLRLEGTTVAVLGASSEMGPLPALLRWGARVAAVDLPNPQVWERVLRTAHRGAGTLVLPVVASPSASGQELPERAGVDLLTGAPLVAQWLSEQLGRVVVGNYVYADGAANLRVCTAVDLLTTRLQAAHPDVALAFLATPTDVFAVPEEAQAQAARAFESRSRLGRMIAGPLGTLSRGRLLQPNYGASPVQADTAQAVVDSLVPQQGPNYALAKRVQRWRATVARAEGSTVSMNIAPPTRTRSVIKNRALAAAYAGAHRFGVEVFEPACANVLMAALLVHDLNTGGGPRHEHPWQDEAYAAVHGGLWRAPYEPRSALGLAALLGLAGARA